MKETLNYKLKKPEQNDYVNIEDLNYNVDIIDEKIKETESQLADMTQQIENIDLSADKVKVNNSNLKSKDVNSALTELFTFADNYKKAVSNIIGSPITSKDTAEQVKEKIQSMKDSLVKIIKELGETSTSNEALQELIKKLYVGVSNLPKSGDNITGKVKSFIPTLQTSISDELSGCYLEYNDDNSVKFIYSCTYTKGRVLELNKFDVNLNKITQFKGEEINRIWGIKDNILIDSFSGYMRAKRLYGFEQIGSSYAVGDYNIDCAVLVDKENFVATGNWGSKSIPRVLRCKITNESKHIVWRYEDGKDKFQQMYFDKYNKNSLYLCKNNYILCLSYLTGQVLWEKDYTKQFSRNTTVFAYDKNFVYFYGENSSGSIYIVKKENGDLVKTIYTGFEITSVIYFDESKKDILIERYKNGECSIYYLVNLVNDTVSKGYLLNTKLGDLDMMPKILVNDTKQYNIFRNNFKYEGDILGLYDLKVNIPIVYDTKL